MTAPGRPGGTETRAGRGQRWLNEKTGAQRWSPMPSVLLRMRPLRMRTKPGAKQNTRQRKVDQTHVWAEPLEQFGGRWGGGWRGVGTSRRSGGQCSTARPTEPRGPRGRGGWSAKHAGPRTARAVRTPLATGHRRQPGTMKIFHSDLKTFFFFPGNDEIYL